MVCGAIVGAQRGYLYIRHEYELQTEVLRDELARIYSLGLSAKHPRLRHRLRPRSLRQPRRLHLRRRDRAHGSHPGQSLRAAQQAAAHRQLSGVWNKPTALNNVETFALAITILGNGGEWYKAHGRDGSPGSSSSASPAMSSPRRLRSPHGHHLSRTDLRPTPAALRPAAEVIGFAPSGPSSGYLPASHARYAARLGQAVKALGSMVGSGAVVVCDDTVLHARHGPQRRPLLSQRELRQVLSLPHRHPEAGRPARKLDARQHQPQATTGLLDDLSHVLKQASLCGLGQIAPAPIQSVIKHFPEM